MRWCMNNFDGRRGKTLFFWLGLLGAGLLVAYFMQSLLVSVLVFVVIYFSSRFFAPCNAHSENQAPPLPENQAPLQDADFGADDIQVFDDAPDTAMSSNENLSGDYTGVHFDTPSYFFMDPD